MKKVLPLLRLVLLPLAFDLSIATADGEDGEPSKTPFRELQELTFLNTGDPLADWSSRRIWTSIEGKSIAAKILGVKEDHVALGMENGKSTTLPIARLSKADRRFIREWEAISVYFNLGYEPPRNIANTIEAAIFDGAFAKEGKVHETRNFRFECDAVLTQEVVKDFSRLFEVTYLGVAANPLGLAIARPEGGKFQVKLFSSDGAYLNAGGTEDAAGVYLIKDRVMLVPLSSLGLTQGSSGYKKTREFDPRTLIHETTHALTHQWLTHAPMWFVEGFAEYVAAIPYKDGRLELSRHREGLLDLATKKFGGDPARFDLISPEKFTGISHQVFMGEPEPGEQEIRLPTVKPFQITLVSNSGGAAKPAGDSATEIPGEADDPSERAGNETAIAPPGNAPRQPTGPIVVQHYISSMALVHHLLSSGQTTEFRRYLFDFARFEWDLNRYLERFEKTHKAHHTAVEEQIREFGTELRRFNAAIDTYNGDVDRYNRRELNEPPTLPTEPVIPAPLPVPGILSRPRTVSELSRKQFLEKAWERYLEFDGEFSLESLR